MACANPFEYYSFEFNEFITGYHVYKSTWVLFVNEQVFGEVQFDNDHDPNAVKLMKDSKVVGHIPRMFAKAMRLVLLVGGSVKACFTGKPGNTRGNGQEVPCNYVVKGPAKQVKLAETLVLFMLKR